MQRVPEAVAMQVHFDGVNIGKAALTAFAHAAGRRRVVLTAYVGVDPVPLLGDVGGMAVYCSPSPTGTSAEGVLALTRAGAQVFFVPKLHMKVYWVEGAVALVGSPNLSANGLAGGLAEILVEVDPAEIPIDAIIASLRGVVDASPDRIAKLYRANALARRRGGAVGEPAELPLSGKPPRGPRVPVRSFTAWHADRRARPWKLAWWDDDIDVPSEAKRDARAKGFRSEPDSVHFADGARTYEPGDWLLSIRTKGDFGSIAKPKTIEWMFVDGVTSLTDSIGRRKAKAAGRVAAWEVAPSPRDPPFALTPKVKRALAAAWDECRPAWSGAEKDPPESTLVALPEDFFATILRHLGEGA